MRPGNGSAYRLGSSLGCGFSFRKGAPGGEEFGARDIVDHCYILVYLLRGRGIYNDENGVEFALEPGVLYQRFPGLRHSNRFDGREDFFEAYAVLPRQVGELLLASGAVSTRRPCAKIGVAEELADRFEGFMEALRVQPEDFLHLTLAAMHAFAAELASLAAGGQPQDAFAKEACALLERGLERRLSMPGVARRLGMSYSKFRQGFAARLGCSPGEYRLRKRIELTQRLLASEPLSMKEAAKAAGFSDVYSFSKQFKLRSGLSPGRFAKLRRKGL